ncbi:MAG: response regulator [Luteitalea sp.]|nr:response regulator [Luteitalea sp.]
MPSRIRVVIVDDHPVVRFGLAAIINLQPDMIVVGEAGSGQEACSICAETTADVVLMDASHRCRAPVELAQPRRRRSHAGHAADESGGCPAAILRARRVREESYGDSSEGGRFLSPIESWGNRGLWPRLPPHAAPASPALAGWARAGPGRLGYS